MISRTDHRHLDDIIRRAFHSVMREYLAPVVETEEFQVRLASAIAARCIAQGVPKPRIEAPLSEALRTAAPEPVTEAPSATQAAPPLAGPWTVGTGPGRRVTEAGRQRIKAMLADGKAAAEVAAELGVSQRTIHGFSASTSAPKVPQSERDATRAEKVRAYQREWVRKRREAKAAPAEAAEPVVQDAQTVAVVPAAEVPAPRQPPSPSLSSLMRTKVAPQPAPPRVKQAPQVITTTPKEVRAWLIAAIKAGGLSRVQAEDRVGFMTHDQALAEANQRRARAGHPPFAFIGSRSAA